MINKLFALVGSGRRLRWYLLLCSLYAIAEGAAIGLLIGVITALLDDRPAAAAGRLLPLLGVVIIAWLAQLRVGMIALRLAAQWRGTLYDRIGRQLVRVPLGFFDSDRTGSIPRLIASDVSRVAGIVFLSPAVVATVLTPLTIGIFLFAADWRLATVAVVCVPMIIIVFVLAARLSDRTDAEHESASADAAARLVEFAQAQPLLRSTDSGVDGRRDLDTALDARHRAARRQVLGALPVHYLGQLAVQLGFTALLVVTVIVVLVGGAAPSSTVALLVAGISFLRPFAVIAGLATALRASSASVDRIATLLEIPELPTAPEPVLPAGGGLRFDDVRFGYSSGDPVLTGFDLTVPEASTTALVGASGSGKTTVTKLAARFFDVDSGAVRVGGVDVREIDPSVLLSSVALVFQDVRLLDTTIAENIRAGRPEATDAEVCEAARLARVLPIIERVDGGWDAPVGEGGRLLSGGERQRVAIARALCKDAPIVLLDEATSSLDAENERDVHAALDALAADRTVLIIAHQLGTIAGADAIAFLHDGRVVEHGSHDELMALDGRYAGYWRERRAAAGWDLAGQSERIAK